MTDEPKGRARLRIDLATRRIEARDGDRTDTWRIDTVRRASKAYGRAWEVIFLEAARALARTRMSPATAAVLWWCIGHCHPRDWTLARHDRIAAEVGLTRSGVTRAIGELVERGLVQRGEPGMLRTSLWLGWQGTAQAYQSARRARGPEMEAARRWHLEHALGEEQRQGAWRMSSDADGIQPREREAVARRGGEAKGIGALVARYAEGGDDGGGDGEG